ncbi:MAG: DUF4350 domain-containing protein [Halobacteriaceae archaeon]
MASRRAKLGRASAAVLVAAAVVGVAAGVPVLVVPDREPATPPSAPPAFDPASIAPEPIPATGTVDASADGDGTLVLIDRSHGQRIDRDDLSPLVGALVRAGARVETVTDPRGLEERLAAADALVVADPAVPYGPAQLDAVESFVDDGGRLLVAAEPTRRGAGAFGSTRRSRVTALASRFGVAFGTGYLYNMAPADTDATFKNVLVTAADDRAESPAAGVERGAVYTAAPVWTVDGRTLLETRNGTHLSTAEGTGTYPVAALAADGDVLAVGDTSLFGGEYHAVADNEVFVAGVADFLLGA